MNRRLLLAVAGLGTAAAAIFLMSGTAHALAPAPPVNLAVPKPPGVAPVTTATTKVVHEVKRAAPVKQVVATVPVVVNRVTGTVDHSLAAATAVAHRSLAVAPDRLRIARSSRTSEVRAAVFTSTGSPRRTTQMRSTTRPASHHSTVAFGFAGLSDNAPTVAQSSAGSPFASIATRAPFVSTAMQWLAFPTADRTRPGFLVGSARPG